MKPDSLILDIDGTLWNSTPIVAKAWNEAIAGRADVSIHFTPEILKGQFGKLVSVIADNVFPDLEPKDRYQLMDVCCAKEHEALVHLTEDIAYPLVRETIRELSKTLKLFIVSNCQGGYIELTMEKNGIADCITDFECPAYSGLAKAENISLIVRRNHLKSPVYVGDTMGDCEASKKAGVPFCYASYGFGTVENPDYRIEQFSDLLRLFGTPA